MVTGTACANGQVFMLRVASCVRRETTVENYTLLVKLHISKENRHLYFLISEEKGKKVTMSSWPIPRSNTHSFIYSCHSVCQALEKDSMVNKVNSELPSGKQHTYANNQIKMFLWLPDSEVID